MVFGGEPKIATAHSVTPARFGMAVGEEQIARAFVDDAVMFLPGRAAGLMPSGVNVRSSLVWTKVGVLAFFVQFLNKYNHRGAAHHG